MSRDGDVDRDEPAHLHDAPAGESTNPLARISNLRNNLEHHFQFFLLRKLMQGEKSDPRAPLGGNFRPTQPQNSRSVRTNVAVKPGRVSVVCGFHFTGMK